MKTLWKAAGRWLMAAAMMVGMMWPATAAACATCFGKSDSKLAEGLNMGIFALLGLVLLVLGWMAGFFIYLARRARRMALEGDLSHSTTISPP